MAIEAFTCTIVFKNLFSFALTYKAFDWLLGSGSKGANLFNPVASVQLAVCLLTVPMCKSTAPSLAPSLDMLTPVLCVDIFGKRIRSFFYRNDILAFFKVR